VSPLPPPVTFPALGTTAVVAVADPRLTNTAVAAVEEEISAIDRTCSRFRPDSELTLVNGRGGTTTPVSPLLLDALGVALEAARLTDGLLDPTVGGAMRVLGYDRDFGLMEKVGSPLVVSVGRAPGWRLVVVDRPRSTVLIPVGVEIDLGATAKALCADRAAAAAFSRTGTGVLVSLGGDMAAAGPAPEAGWSVLVTDDHASPVDAPGQRVAIRSGGLATSGITVRRWARGEQQLHHLIDPATGMPVQACWRTVTVTAGTCVDANTASTAAVILGEAAPAWLAGRRLPARLVAIDGTVTTVSGWPVPQASPC
jgi:thiamine biosynthesis lipoprotein